jgi:hypothetical protein
MRSTLGLLLSLLVLAPAGVADDKDKADRKKEAEKRLAKLPEYCKERRATHLVELLAEWGEFADANQQDELMALGAALAADAKEEVGLNVRPRIGYRGTSATTADRRIGSDASAYFVDEFVCTPPLAGRTAEHVLGKHVLVASRTLTARPNQPTRECVVFTNAAVATFPTLSKSIIVSSGSVDSDDYLSGVLIVCRGDATFRMWEREASALVRAGGKVTNAITIKEAAKPDPDRVFANDTKLLGVKFYSVAEDGLTATAEKAGVTVSKLDDKKPFAAAGLKTGDVIETVNGEKVPTLHELDRLLVRATVASGTARLKLKRGNAAQVIEVKLADW